MLSASELIGSGPRASAAGAIGASRHRAPKETSGALEKLKASDIRELLERQGYKCALTGRELTPDVASLDHIIPIARGGSNTIGNVQVLHKDVNSAKGVMLQADFVAMCREVAKHFDKSA